MKFYRKLGIVFCFCILSSFFSISILGNRLNPILLNYLNLEVERITSNVIDASVNDVLVDGLDDDLFHISKNSDNEIEMIDYDTQKVNLLLKKINQNIYSKLMLMEEGKFQDFDLSSSLIGKNFSSVDSGIICEIPIGSLFENGFFNNLGPIIPIKMSFLGQVSSSLQTKITEYGINNLYLELFVQVEIKERISLPISSRDIRIHIDAPLSIKIISGVVPDYYGGIINSSSQTFFY